MVDVIGRAKVIVEGVVDTASVRKSGGSIGDILKKSALVGGAALGTLAVGAVKTYQAFEEAEANSRKLTQVLDNMSKSEAAPAVEKLADELARMSGVDDDVIKQGETLLATFSTVAKSAGEVGGIFDRATRAAVDLAATGFGDVSSASVMLGKALQDPVKGITALRRAGVTFTDSQKEQIKNFVKANDLASAQKLILQEVEHQVKGTAKANATETKKIQNAWGELEENVGGLVADLADALAGSGKGKKRSLSGAIYDVSDSIDEFSKSASWKQLRRNVGETADLIGRVSHQANTLFDWWDKLEKKHPILAESFKLLLDPAESAEKILGKLGGAAKTLAHWYEQVFKFGQKVHDMMNDQGQFSTDNPFAGGDTSPRMGRSPHASGGPASGWTTVNENGPELIRLPNNSYVYPTSASKEMLSGGGGNFTYAPQYFGPVSGSDILAEYKWANRFAPRFGALTATVAG